MELGQIGPLTEFLESVATVVGAGMIVGGFAIGYVGGVAGVAMVLIDVALRYG